MSKVKIPVKVMSQVLKIRATGMANMFDTTLVFELATLLEYPELVSWIKEHWKEYPEIIFGRFEIENTIEGAVLDITKECKTVNDPEYGVVVKYKDVILWYTAYPDVMTYGCEIALVKGDDDEGYTIIGKTPVIGRDDCFDYTTYGDWETLEEAKAWLDKPTTLY